MKRLAAILPVLTLSLIALPAGAHEGHDAKAASTTDSKMAGATKTSTITGEVIDTGCYLAHGARGEKHVSCASKCINNGMPMGLLTSDGTLYLVTLNHDNADPYNSLKNMAGKNVTVTGELMSRSGIQGIDVSAVRPAAK